jgi:GDP-L-fucose synthase
VNKHASIFIAGCENFVGKAIRRRLLHEGFDKCSDDLSSRVNLRENSSVEQYFREQNPEYVFLVAGKSGGIQANLRSPADLMRDNLLVQTHILHNANRYRSKKLLFLASSCSYPGACPQPMKIDDLMSGPLEPSNEAYAMAKLAGVTMVRAYRQQYGVNFISGIPGNVFGPDDDFHPDSAHVIPCLMIKMHEAKKRQNPSLEVWGTGDPLRQFIFVDDVAAACIYVMEHYHDDAPINLGGAVCVSIRDLALQLKDIVGFGGELVFNTAKPDGMPMKALDSGPLLDLGWSPMTSLSDGLRKTYTWFQDSLRKHPVGRKGIQTLVH